MPLSIQTQRWLMQTGVCRFVGFVSAVVGLLSYALSSSFNHLFGEWNFLKVFLYFALSFIICFMTLFAKVWQFSTSALFKAHMSVLILMTTSVYSFFHDKAVNGKPDAYILISCFAFAVMSLSLSKLTQCGIEMDLVNFFLGCLIILLMKINVLLAIVGAGFSYFLTIFRSSLNATPESEYSEDYVVIQVDSQRANTDSAIQIDSQLVNTDSAIQIGSLRVNGALIMQELKSCISALKKMDDIIQRQLYRYMEKYLEVYNFSKNQAENHFEVHIFSKGLMVTDDYLFINLLPPETINRLQETVKQMVTAGFEKECCHVYSSGRRKFLQKCLMRLHFQDSSIEKCVKASSIILRILLPCERKLCDRVFFGFSSVADMSFTEVCRELTVGLIDFPNNSIFPITWQLGAVR